MTNPLFIMRAGPHRVGNLAFDFLRETAERVARHQPGTAKPVANALGQCRTTRL